MVILLRFLYQRTIGALLARLYPPSPDDSDGDGQIG